MVDDKKFLRQSGLSVYYCLYGRLPSFFMVIPLENIDANNSQVYLMGLFQATYNSMNYCSGCLAVIQ